MLGDGRKPPQRPPPYASAPGAQPRKAAAVVRQPMTPEVLMVRSSQCQNNLAEESNAVSKWKRGNLSYTPQAAR